MQDKPVRKKPGYAGRVYKPRRCLDCQLMYRPRSSQQKRCEDCQHQENLRRGRESAARARDAKYEPQSCADCGTELPRQGRARPRIRCEPCAAARIVAHDRERNKQRSADGSRKIYDARWRDSHRDEINEASRQYRLSHPEVSEAHVARRRVRMYAGTDELDRALTSAYRKAIREDPCFYCGDPGTEFDHYFPLSKGGTDHWFNVVRSCRQCNRGPGSKLAKCGTAWMLRRGDWRTGSFPLAA